MPFLDAVWWRDVRFRSSSTVITDERCQFKGNTASTNGLQIMNNGATVTLTCLPGQYNSIENGGQVDTNFTGCSNLCPKGKYANGTASRDLSGCISCPLTKTCPRDGTGSPVPCPAGRFGAEEGLTSLKCSGACDPGHYCPVGATNSTFRSCPAGRFVSVPGSSNVSNCSTCKASFYCEEAALFERPCPSGTYGNETGLESSRCSGDCPPGFFCPTQTNQPQRCPQGTFSMLGNATCIGCPAGYSAASEASAGCDKCGPGTYAGFQRSARCTQCSPGSFQSIDGETHCELCPSGYFQDQPSSSSCKRATGGVADGNGSTSVEVCGRGTFMNVDASKCVICPAGQYSDTLGSTACKHVPSGNQVSGNRTFVTPCPVGTFSEDYTCRLCPAGYYQNMSKQTSCRLAVTGVAATAGASAVDVCAAGRYMDVNASTCIDCDAGRFSTKPGSPFCATASSGFEVSSEKTYQTPCPVGKYKPDIHDEACSSMSAWLLSGLLECHNVPE